MKTLLRSFVCFVCFVGLTATAHAQKNVQKSDATATRDEITADLKFGTGKTLNFLSGSALNFGNATLTGTIPGANGGTGAANTGKTLTLAGNVTTSGAFNLTLTQTGNTTVTLPTTGTLATLAGTETLANKAISATSITTPIFASTGVYSLNTFTAGAGHAGINIHQSEVGTTTEEGTVNYTGFTTGPTTMQWGSVSAMQSQAANNASWFSFLRFHANYGLNSASSNVDMRIGGNKGVTFFAPDDTAAYFPGPGIVRAVNGTFQVSGTGTAGAAALWNNANRLFIGGDTGGVFFQNAANSATNLTLTDAGAASLRAGFTATSFTVSGGSVAALTMRSASNYLVFQGGTAGYLFQNTDNTATLLGITNAGTATFGGVTVLKNYTVATLPTASGFTYGVAFVSDATNAAGTGAGAAPTGGGSVKRMVYSDGTNWLLQ